ncbi:hypothetical protein K449DRAFT_460284 [Hypoxylon sp. EC38]|nr:hypothetical protein K449DRAFT_460284 [Hypoxylon sp. EC38]
MAQPSDNTPTNLVGDKPVADGAPGTEQQHLQGPESPSEQHTGADHAGKEQPAMSSAIDRTYHHGLPFGLKRPPGNDILHYLRTHRFFMIEMRKAIALAQDAVDMCQYARALLSEEDVYIPVGLQSELTSLSKEVRFSLSKLESMKEELDKAYERAEGQVPNNYTWQPRPVVDQSPATVDVRQSSPDSQHQEVVDKSTTVSVATDDAKVAHPDETTTVSSTDEIIHGFSRSLSL